MQVAEGRKSPEPASALDAAAPGGGQAAPGLSLGWRFVARARRGFFRLAALDSTGRRLTAGQLLAGAVTLARVLRPLWKDEAMAGICLPPSVAGAAVNLAAALLGKPAVNLNYTASTETLRAILERCGIRKVVSSEAFLAKAKRELPAPVIPIESLASRRGAVGRALDFLCAGLLPAPLLARCLGARRATSDDLAAVMFSSGSTGEPKGVMQTHGNIAANIEAVTEVIALGSGHRLLGVLPLFHSTGYTFGLWAPLLTGMPVVYHPNPLEARAVGKLVKEENVTILFATPTLLQTYARRCSPEEFASLKFVIAGAEKLTERVAALFQERFGLEPLEGYGCTATSPLVSLKLPDPPLSRVAERQRKVGTVGKPLVGVRVRIVHPETGAELPRGAEGLILVHGPNVMKGYLGNPELTAQALTDGWYHTGDVGRIDDDGYLVITGRLSRFSKIGGEMVPHGAVEEALHGVLGLSDQALCVASLPDLQKGERLAVVHTLPEEKLQELLAKLPSSGLPNLWLPRRDDFVRVEALPLLGTGKLDLKRVEELAGSALAAKGD